MLDTKVYNERFRSIMRQLNAEEDTHPEQDALIKRMITLMNYMEQQGYVLSGNKECWYFLKQPGVNTQEHTHESH